MYLITFSLVVAYRPFSPFSMTPDFHDILDSGRILGLDYSTLCHKFRLCTNPMTLHLPSDVLDHCNVVIPCGNFVLLEHPGLISSMYQGSNFSHFTMHSGIEEGINQQIVVEKFDHILQCY